MSNAICILDGCEKPARSNSGESMCKMHYHRWYRHGSPEMVATATEGVSLGRRYVLKSDKGHPLAAADGRVYAHRKVLFDHIGPGPHACHWCGTEVDWLPKSDPRQLQPDHLNNDGGDNRVENLVPACRRCNTARGGQRRAAALRGLGFWSHHDTVGALGTRQPPVQRAS